jgi:hypothetical protein
MKPKFRRAKTDSNLKSSHYAFCRNKILNRHLHHHVLSVNYMISSTKLEICIRNDVRYGVLSGSFQLHSKGNDALCRSCQHALFPSIETQRMSFTITESGTRMSASVNGSNLSANRPSKLILKTLPPSNLPSSRFFQQTCHGLYHVQLMLC